MIFITNYVHSYPTDEVGHFGFRVTELCVSLYVFLKEKRVYFWFTPNCFTLLTYTMYFTKPLG